MTVAPVVVNPDMDSNHEFTAPRAMSMSAMSGVKGPLNIPPSQYGSAPMRTAIGHTRATPAKASLSLNRSLVFVRVPKLTIKMPTNADMKDGIANALSASSTESSAPVNTPHKARGIDNAMSVHPKIRYNTSERMAITP